MPNTIFGVRSAATPPLSDYVLIELFIKAMTSNDRTPMDQPAILIEHERPPQSVTDFYSPMDTARHSDEEDEEVSYSCMRIFKSLRNRKVSLATI